MDRSSASIKPSIIIYILEQNNQEHIITDSKADKIGTTLALT